MLLSTLANCLSFASRRRQFDHIGALVPVNAARPVALTPTWARPRISKLTTEYGRSYQEWWRDWPFEATATGYPGLGTVTVPSPTLRSSGGKDESGSLGTATSHQEKFFLPWRVRR